MTLEINFGSFQCDWSCCILVVEPCDVQMYSLDSQCGGYELARVISIGSSLDQQLVPGFKTVGTSEQFDI